MVDLVYDPTVKAKESEKEPHQPSNPKNQIDPIDFPHTELDDLSLKFDDSSFDFDSIKDWIIEDPETYMAGSNPDPLIVDPVKAEFEIVESKESGNLGSLIEKEMEKVSLEGSLDESSAELQENKSENTCLKINEENNLEIKCEDQNPVEKIGVSDDVVKKIDASVGDGDDDDDENESEESENESSESSSSSSESSSSSSSDDDVIDDDADDDDDEKQDIEEGEIRDANVDEMVAWSDEEDEAVGVKARPVTSKNELQVLPPVPPVNVTLQPFHHTSPVGVVISIVDAKVIVEGVENHNPLNEGSILWITETRSPLGLVDEIFGPVKNPYYIVRYNLDNEVPKGIQEGTLISFVPEFVNHILNNSNLYKKGYDASNEYDEELSDELEFSDDEKEAEYRKMKKQMAKRVSNDQNLGNRNGDKKKFKNKGGNKWKNDQKPSPTPPPGNTSQSQSQGQSQSPSRPAGGSGPGPVQGFGGGPGPVPQFRQLAPRGGFWGNGMMPGQQPQMVQGFAGGPTSGPVFGQLAQGPGFPGPVPNGVWVNGLGNGFPQNGMTWQQYGPAPGGVQFQQQFNVGPGMVPNFGAGPVFPTWQPNQGGMQPPGVNPVQPNFGVGPGFATWQPNQGGFNQPQGGMGPVNMGENGMMMSAPNSVMPPGVNPAPTGPPAGFNQGASFGRGGRGFRGGGGRFGRGRGRQQSK